MCFFIYSGMVTRWQTDGLQIVIERPDVWARDDAPRWEVIHRQSLAIYGTLIEKEERCLSVVLCLSL